jgi:hypothetical protein
LSHNKYARPKETQNFGKEILNEVMVSWQNTIETDPEEMFHEDMNLLELVGVVSHKGLF